MLKEFRKFILILIILIAPVYLIAEQYQPTYISTSTYQSYDEGYGEISSETGRPKTVHVRPYVRKDGTPVKGHYRSPPQKSSSNSSNK